MKNIDLGAIWLALAKAYMAGVIVPLLIDTNIAWSAYVIIGGILILGVIIGALHFAYTSIRDARNEARRFREAENDRVAKEFFSAESRIRKSREENDRS